MLYVEQYLVDPDLGTFDLDLARGFEIHRLAVDDDLAVFLERYFGLSADNGDLFVDVEHQFILAGDGNGLLHLK